MRSILCAIVLLSAAGTASAQSSTGNFAAFNGWWVHPTAGNLGVGHDGSFVNVDRDGDGVTDVAFPNSQVAAEARSNLRLSPTREYLVGWGGTCGTSGVNFYVWSIPPAPSTTLTTVVNGTCVDRVNGAPDPRFYDTGLCQDMNPGLVCTNLGVSPKRIAYILTGSAIFGDFELVWIDLATGTVATTVNTNFHSNAGFIHVSPSGTQAFVQHDLGTPGETDYTLVDLCPGSLGQAINAGGFPISNSSEVLRAETTAVAAGQVTVTAFDQSSNPEATFTLTDCCAPDPTGACCRLDRSCDADVTAAACGAGDTFLQGQGCGSCVFPPLTEACCLPNGQCSDAEVDVCMSNGGAPGGGGSMCSTTVCPSVDLVVDPMGPTVATEGDSITYTVDIRNDGTLASGDLTLQVQRPASTILVSATPDPVVFGATLSWDLPPLPPSGSSSVSFTVMIDCGISMIRLPLTGTLLTDAFGNFDQPDAHIDTTINPIASGPVGVSVASAPSAGPPVPGDTLITHTIQLDNSFAQSQDGLLLTGSITPTPAGFELGQGVNFEAIVDAGPGTFDVQGSLVNWQGSLPPGTTTISFTARVLACLPPGLDATQLNDGDDLSVINSCGTLLGSGTASPQLALERPILATLESPTLDTVARLLAPASSYNAQLTRPGARVQLQLRLASGSGQPVVGADVDLQLISFGSPALVAPSDPAASFNPGNMTASWTGTIPATGDVVVTLEADVTACRGLVELRGGSSPSCLDVQEDLVIAAVPAPPALGQLIALGYGQPPIGFAEAQILQFDPALDTQFSTQLCLPSEFMTGIGVGRAGDVWAGWLPTFHYDPSTLELHGFDWRRLSGAGITSLADIAVDPRNDDVYFIGSGDLPPFSTQAIVARYVPGTDLLTQVVQDSARVGYNRGVVDSMGDLVVVSSTGEILRVDHSDWSIALVDTGESIAAADVDLDASDDYVALLGRFVQPHPLVEIDSDDVDPPIVIDTNLATTFPDGTTFGWRSVAVDPVSDDVFVAPSAPGLGVVHRDAAGNSVGADVPIAFDLFGSRGRADDLHWQSIPEPSAAWMTAASLLMLACLSRWGRRRAADARGRV